MDQGQAQNATEQMGAADQAAAAGGMNQDQAQNAKDQQAADQAAADEQAKQNAAQDGAAADQAAADQQVCVKLRISHKTTH